MSSKARRSLRDRFLFVPQVKKRSPLSYNRTKASRKTDTSSNPLRLGTFLSDYNSAWLGNYAALADYNRGGLSEEVSIPQGSKVYFTEITSVKNNTDCFSRVESHKFEPNNNNVVKLNFSANKK